MKHHLNTLFVTTEGMYLKKDGQAVVVSKDRQTLLRVPLHNLDGICCMARVMLSPPLMAACAQAGVTISLLSQHGRFLAAVVGFTSGNVLLRREQYRRADDTEASVAIARNVILGKFANARTVLLRAAREATGQDSEAKSAILNQAAHRISTDIHAAKQACSLERLRGIEGESATTYFGVFNQLLTGSNAVFQFKSRNRRPPRDAVNALLSFLYSMLAHDARSACEAAGLDAAVGFLHRDRPGRPSLALDLMEEFRPFFADRLALSLINRKQVAPNGFTITESGAMHMDEKTRKTVLAAYQTRKQEVITHPFLNEKTSVGLLVHLQARLLARHLRGDLEAYPPFMWK